MRHYINACEFNDFKENQERLIGILNHNMTEITIDVKWIKKIIGWIAALTTGIAIATITYMFNIL